jgi:RNA polymerase primary sigma factor
MQFPKHLPWPEQRRLLMRARAGDVEARNRLIETNLGLVGQVLDRYFPVGVRGKLEYEDLIQEGVFGLAKAIDRFDMTQGYMLSTYAHLWIRQAIGRAIEREGRTIRLPAHAHNNALRVRRVETAVKVREGREPTLEELAEQSKLSVSEVKQALELEVLTKPSSLDWEGVSAAGEEISGMHELIPDQSESALDGLVRDAEQDMLRQAMSVLPERHRLVLELRYGLGAEVGPYTLKETGNKLGLTRERVRQIQVKALAVVEGELHKLRRRDLL